MQFNNNYLYITTKAIMYHINPHMYFDRHKHTQRKREIQRTYMTGA